MDQWFATQLPPLGCFIMHTNFLFICHKIQTRVIYNSFAFWSLTLDICWLNHIHHLIITIMIKHKIIIRSIMFKLTLTRSLWYWPLIIIFNWLYNNFKNWINLGKIWTYKHHTIALTYWVKYANFEFLLFFII